MKIYINNTPVSISKKAFKQLCYGNGKIFVIKRAYNNNLESHNVEVMRPEGTKGDEFPNMCKRFYNLKENYNG